MDNDTIRFIDRLFKELYEEDLSKEIKNIYSEKNELVGKRILKIKAVIYSI